MNTQNMGKCIVILQRGWIVIGMLFKTNEQYLLKEASVIRKWGTTKGLGEISKFGPTKETILDSISDVIFHELTAIAIIKCEF